MEVRSHDSAQSDVEMKSSSEQETKPKKPKEAKHSPKVKRELDDLKQVSCVKNSGNSMFITILNVYSGQLNLLNKVISMRFLLSVLKNIHKYSAMHNVSK